MTDAALRMRVFAFVAIVLFGGLVARLWYLQGLEAQQQEFERRAQTNVYEQVFECIIVFIVGIGFNKRQKYGGCALIVVPDFIAKFGVV